MTTKVKCFNIKWAVEAEDVCDNLPENATDEDIEKEIALVKQGLPDEVVLTLPIEWETEDEAEQIISDALSEETGWLHEGFDFDVVSKE